MKEATGQVRTIHPEVLKGVGLEAATALLRVAHGLRSGEIREEWYAQYWIGPNGKYGLDFIDKVSNSERSKTKCGSACCIIGWTRAFLTDSSWSSLRDLWMNDAHLGELFSGEHPSDPQLAANAIEAFIYDYKENPWGVESPA